MTIRSATLPIALGRTSLKILPLGVGAMTWGDPTLRDRLNAARLLHGTSEGRLEEEDALLTSLAAGVRLFDTAATHSFGASERRLGELAIGREIVIATKFAVKPKRANAEDLLEELSKSLRRLGRATIDLYQINFPTPTLPAPRVFDLLADAVEDGRIGAVGVSNFSEEQMRVAHACLARRGIPLASNRVQYSLLHRKPEVNGVLKACRELGITLIAHTPLAMGALTGKYSQRHRPSGLRRFRHPFRGRELEKVTLLGGLLAQTGEEYKRSAADVALRWLIQQGVVPIPGAKSARQAADNARALSFSLSSADMYGLSEATHAWR